MRLTVSSLNLTNCSVSISHSAGCNVKLGQVVSPLMWSYRTILELSSPSNFAINVLRIHRLGVLATERRQNTGVPLVAVNSGGTNTMLIFAQARSTIRRLQIHGKSCIKSPDDMSSQDIRAFRDPHIRRRCHLAIEARHSSILCFIVLQSF